MQSDSASSSFIGDANHALSPRAIASIGAVLGIMATCAISTGNLSLAVASNVAVVLAVEALL